ncbi:unnamed protein product [Cyclocybe aegerita]|uniref:F-box domain-containing protein n=1 Tax=Cyclocybe aegerita TaxID=1973307 RepID=A0A8S0WLG6_CYCAE|nr:unnamed protein product [Cyclocybe aegerita]
MDVLQDPEFEQPETLVKQDDPANEITEGPVSRILTRDIQDNTYHLVLSLPVELLVEVFIWVIETHNGYRFPLPAQLTLGRVCRLWRNVIWRTPRLWTLISIAASHTRCSAQAKLLKGWIGRAQGMPLRVHLKTHLLPQEPLELYDVFLASSSQWASFSLSGGPFKQFCDRLRMSKPKFDLLASLVLCPYRQFLSSSASIQWHFADAPQLRTLRSYENRAIGLARLPLHQIHDLEANFDTVEWLSLLGRLRSLRKCRLILNLSFAQPLPHEIVLPKLTELCICVEHTSTLAPSCIGSILSTITVPRLQSLHVLRWYQRFPFSDLVNMIERSGNPLTRVSIDVLELRETDLFDLLQNSPCLTELSARRGLSLSDRIINLLNPQLPKASSITQCLQDLKVFKYEGRIDFTPPSVISMLKARLQYSQLPTPSSTKLNLLQIRYTNTSWTDEHASDDVEGLLLEAASLKQFGTEVVIKSRKNFSNRNLY